MVRRGLLVLILPVALGASAGCLPPPLIPCGDHCDSAGSTSTGSGEQEEMVPTSGGAMETLTSEAPDVEMESTTTTTTGGEEVETTGEPLAEVPVIVEEVVIPDYIDEPGWIDVAVTTMYADGVRLALDSGAVIELTAGRPGEFVGQIAAFTGLDNGKRTAVLTPWQGAIDGESVVIDYVIALPPAGHELGWEVSGAEGNVAAIGVLPDGRPVEFGTFRELGEPRCYLKLRDRDGALLASTTVLASAYCRAIDLKVDRASGRMRVLVERESGGEVVWWAGELTAWGKGVKGIGVGAVGDTAYALGDSPEVAAVCGTRAVETEDKFDALAVLLRGDAPAEVRVFDYRPMKDPQEHDFTDTVRDCVFAGETLVLVGEVRGNHDLGILKLRDRLMILESDLAGADEPAWNVAGLDQGVQTRGLALDLDGQGRYVIAGYACADTCEPSGEVRSYEPGGKLVGFTSLGPLGSAWAGPHDIAWSPAGHAVVALGEQKGQTFLFKVQGVLPGVALPLWSFVPKDQQGLQLALAVAVGPQGEVYAGGIAAEKHPAFARIGG